MKSVDVPGVTVDVASHPARGAWIEMPPPCMATKSRMSHPARGAWIEILLVFDHFLSVRSHPARGAWIEIVATQSIPSGTVVAPRKGCVD